MISIPNNNNGGNQSVAAGASLAVTLPFTPSLGNILLVCVGLWDAVTGITEGVGGNTYTSLTTFTADTSHENSEIWWALMASRTPTSITVNTNGAGSRWRAATILEIAGADQASPVIVPFANDASGTSDSKTITPTADGSIIVSCLNTTGSSSTVPTGFTGFTPEQTGTTDRNHVAYLIQGTAGVSTMNWTGLSAGAFPSVGAVALKPLVTTTSPIQVVNYVQLDKMRVVRS